MPNELPARLLRLLALLQSRREWSGAELADRLGVTGRTVRRDVERLRQLGYPVAGTTGTAGGYRLAAGTDLPPLLLDDDEAVAIAVGLRTAADGTVHGIEDSSVRALAKVEQLLPQRLRRQLAAVGEATLAVQRPGWARVDPRVLAVLAAACRDHEVVRFWYASRAGANSERRVEPHTMVTGYGRWYLVGFDTDRGDWRTFRVDRVTAPSATRSRFAPRALPYDDVRTYVTESLATAPYRYSVTATVRAAAEVVRARLRAALPGRVEPVDEHTSRIHLSADSLDPLLQHLVALDADFTVHDAPPELLDRLRRTAIQLHSAAPTA